MVFSWRKPPKQQKSWSLTVKFRPVKLIFRLWFKRLCHAALQTCHFPCIPTSDGLDLDPVYVCVSHPFERVVKKVEEEAEEEEEIRKTATAEVRAKQSVTPIQAPSHRNSGTSDLYFTVQSGQPYTQLCLQNIIIQWDFFFCQRHKESLRNDWKKCQSLSSFDFSLPPQPLCDNTTAIGLFKHTYGSKWPDKQICNDYGYSL